MREIGDRRNVIEATLSFETVAAKKKTGHFGQPMSSNEFPMRREAPSPGKKIACEQKGGKSQMGLAWVFLFGCAWETGVGGRRRSLG